MYRAKAQSLFIQIQRKVLMVFKKLMGHEEDPEDRAYIETMLMISMADGEIEDSEIDDLAVSVYSHPKMKRLGNRTVIRILNAAARDIERQGFEARAQAVAKALPDIGKRIDAIGMAISVSASDGDIEPEEVHVLEILQRAFNLTDAQVEQAMQMYR